MSGGVDSAVAALLLKQQGFEVVGVTMKIWKGKNNPKIAHNVCFGPGEINDIRAAKRAAKILGIKHKVIDLSGEYRRYVLDYYKKERLAGRTPNPCVACNQK
jgi:Predicted tRNA(5-methylaminomethyl-2-thiouridylate) methyltransferase, contains the PP-loop ATPase domain